MTLHWVVTLSFQRDYKVILLTPTISVRAAYVKVFKTISVRAAYVKMLKTRDTYGSTNASTVKAWFIMLWDHWRKVFD